MLASPDARQDDPCAQSGQTPSLTSFFRLFSPSPPTISPRHSHRLTINFEQHDKPDTHPQLTSKPPQQLPLASNVTSEQNMLSKERVPGAGFTCIGVALFALLRAKHPASLKTPTPGQKDRNSSPGKNRGRKRGRRDAPHSRRISPAAKPRRPGPEARNHVALKLGVVTISVVALGSGASGSEYTPVSGPYGPLTRRYARSSTGPLRRRITSFFVAISGSGLTGRGMGLVKPIKYRAAAPRHGDPYRSSSPGHWLSPSCADAHRAAK